MTDQPARTMREYNAERRTRQCSPACSEQHTYTPPCQLTPAETRTEGGPDQCSGCRYIPCGNCTPAPERCRVCGSTERLFWRGVGSGLPYCTDCEACECGENPCVRTGINDPAVSAEAVAPAPELREQAAAALLAAAEHRIVAEWICCEPLEKGHDLCAKGYAALRMIRELIVDNPERFPSNGELTDAVLAVPAIQQLAETRDALRVTEGDRDAAEAELQRLREESPWLRATAEDLAEAKAAVDRVRALHRPAQYRGRAICVECSGYDGSTCDNGPQPHPSPTIAPHDPQEPS